MTVISASLPQNLVKELDRLTESGGYSSRSDTIRAGIKLLASEKRQQDKGKGRISAALLLVHDEKDEEAFFAARHDFEEVIKTSVHNQLKDDKCLEIFILDGDFEKIQSLLLACRKSGKADYLKLVVA